MNPTETVQTIICYSRFRNYLDTRMVVRTVKAHLILPQETNSLCYKIDATSVKLFSDFTIKVVLWNVFHKEKSSDVQSDLISPHIEVNFLFG